jgi:prepilin peptidase CpaA
MAICLALYRRKLIETMSNLGALFAHHRTAGLRPHPELRIANAETVRLPYAVAIAAGSAWTLCSFLAGR